MLWMLGVSVRRNLAKHTLALIALASAVALSCLGMSGVTLMMRVVRQPVTQVIGGDLMVLSERLDFTGTGGQLWLSGFFGLFDEGEVSDTIKDVLGESQLSLNLMTGSYVPGLGEGGSLHDLVGRFDPVRNEFYSYVPLVGESTAAIDEPQRAIYVPRLFGEVVWGNVGAEHDMVVARIVSSGEGQYDLDIPGGTPTEMTVSGLYEAAYSAQWVLAPLRTVQELSGARGQVSWIGVSLPSLAREAEARGILQEALDSKGLALQVVDAQALGELMVSDFAHLKRTASLYFPVSVLISTFIIVTTGLSMVVSRKQEFAVLRALGESKRQVALLFVAETAVVSLLGGLLGYLMSVALAPVLVHTAAVMDVTPVFVAVAVAILVSAVVTRSRAFTEITSTLRNQ
jgi:hypothetical protein